MSRRTFKTEHTIARAMSRHVQPEHVEKVLDNFALYVRVTRASDSHTMDPARDAGAFAESAASVSPDIARPRPTPSYTGASPAVGPARTYAESDQQIADRTGLRWRV